MQIDYLFGKLHSTVIIYIYIYIYIYILFSLYIWYFYHITHVKLIIFFSYLHLFCNIFLVFHFFSLLFFRKKYYFLFFIFYTLNIYHSKLGVFIPFFFFLSLLFCKKISLYFFKKAYYTKTKKMMFHCSNCNIIPFFYYIKN